jgi:hypothetical protein
MAMWPQGSDITGKADEMHVESVQGDITSRSVEADMSASAYVSGLDEAVYAGVRRSIG